MPQLMTKDGYAFTPGDTLYIVDTKQNKVETLERVLDFRVGDYYAKRSNALRWLISKLQGDIQDITTKCSWLNQEIRYAERDESGR